MKQINTKQQRKSARSAIVAGLITVGFLTAAAACYYIPKVFLKRKPDSLAAVVYATDGKQIDVPSNQDTIFYVPGGALKSDGKGLLVIPLGQLFDSALQSLKVPMKRIYRVDLPDGTSITLDAASHLLFPTQRCGDSTIIHLEGEGYIQVRGCNDTPVTIVTPTGRIQTSNSSLNINTYDSQETVISVLTGKVRFYGPDSTINIGQGKEYVTGTVSGNALRPIRENRATAWMDGHYYFSQKDFFYVARLIERTSGVPVVIKDTVLGKKIINGSIDKKLSLEENLRGLRVMVPFTYRMRHDTLYIKGVQ